MKLYFINLLSVFKNCNTIDDTYAWLFVPDKVKNMNVKVFSLISGINETKLFLNSLEMYVTQIKNETVMNDSVGVKN